MQRKSALIWPLLVLVFVALASSYQHHQSVPQRVAFDPAQLIGVDGVYPGMRPSEVEAVVGTATSDKSFEQYQYTMAVYPRDTVATYNHPSQRVIGLDGKRLTQTKGWVLQAGDTEAQVEASLGPDHATDDDVDFVDHHYWVYCLSENRVVAVSFNTEGLVTRVQVRNDILRLR